MSLDGPAISVQATMGAPVLSRAMLGRREAPVVALTPPPVALPANSSQPDVP